jgi:hypothetical protein
MAEPPYRMAEPPTFSNGRTIKENGGGTAVVQATQDNSEAVLEI